MNLPPPYWPAFPLVSYLGCPECDRRTARWWDVDDFYCPECGINF